jgi:hypothetical protein
MLQKDLQLEYERGVSDGECKVEEELMTKMNKLKLKVAELQERTQHLELFEREAQRVVERETLRSAFEKFVFFTRARIQEKKYKDTLTKYLYGYKNTSNLKSIGDLKLMVRNLGEDLLRSTLETNRLKRLLLNLKNEQEET